MLRDTVPEGEASAVPVGVMEATGELLGLPLDDAQPELDGAGLQLPAPEPDTETVLLCDEEPEEEAVPQEEAQPEAEGSAEAEAVAAAEELGHWLEERESVGELLEELVPLSVEDWLWQLLPERGGVPVEHMLAEELTDVDTEEDAELDCSRDALAAELWEELTELLPEAEGSPEAL